jgi:hypothetical protein
MLVIRKMEAGEKRANVCSSLGLAPANAEKMKDFFFDKIQQKESGNEAFTASKGRFARFKQRSQIH